MLVREDKTDFSGLVNQNSRYFLQIQNGCDHRCTFCIIHLEEEIVDLLE